MQTGWPQLWGWGRLLEGVEPENELDTLSWMQKEEGGGTRGGERAGLSEPTAVAKAHTLDHCVAPAPALR